MSRLSAQGIATYSCVVKDGGTDNNSGGSMSVHSMHAWQVMQFWNIYLQVLIPQPHMHPRHAELLPICENSRCDGSQTCIIDVPTYLPIRYVKAAHCDGQYSRAGAPVLGFDMA